MSKTGTKKNYIKGSAREVKFNNGGSIINLSLNIEELNKLPSNKGYVQITVAEKQQTDDYGNTHSVYENDFKPSPQAGAAKLVKKETDLPDGGDDDDLPF